MDSGYLSRILRKFESATLIGERFRNSSTSPNELL
jgi:hypothetical protein